MYRDEQSVQQVSTMTRGSCQSCPIFTQPPHVGGHEDVRNFLSKVNVEGVIIRGVLFWFSQWELSVPEIGLLSLKGMELHFPHAPSRLVQSGWEGRSPR